ncbi:MAG: RidA family protein [Vibrio sp.]
MSNSSTANITKVTTGSKFEKMASYSRAVAVNDWIYVSNTAGRNPVTQQMSDDVLEQAEQVFANIERALTSLDSTLADVVMSRVFIQNPEHVAIVMPFIGAKFDGINPATTVTCPPLGSTEYLIEIEVTAFRGLNDHEVKHIDLSQA